MHHLKYFNILNTLILLNIIHIIWLVKYFPDVQDLFFSKGQFNISLHFKWNLKYYNVSVIIPFWGFIGQSIVYWLTLSYIYKIPVIIICVQILNSQQKISHLHSFILWHISATTCQIIMSTSQIFMSSYQIYMLIFISLYWLVTY